MTTPRELWRMRLWVRDYGVVRGLVKRWGEVTVRTMVAGVAVSLYKGSAPDVERLAPAEGSSPSSSSSRGRPRRGRA